MNEKGILKTGWTKPQLRRFPMTDRILDEVARQHQAPTLKKLERST